MNIQRIQSIFSHYIGIFDVIYCSSVYDAYGEVTVVQLNSRDRVRNTESMLEPYKNYLE